jgi:hypothetical protein
MELLGTVVPSIAGDARSPSGALVLRPSQGATRGDAYLWVMRRATIGPREDDAVRLPPGAGECTIEAVPEGLRVTPLGALRAIEGVIGEETTLP